MASKKDMAFLRVCLKTMHSMGKHEFKSCWGQNWDHLWDRLMGSSNSEFILYLDAPNLQKFCEYAEQRNDIEG